MNQQKDSLTRFERGNQALAAIDGAAGERVVAALKDIARTLPGI